VRLGARLRRREGGSWKHPDGTYAFLERSPDLVDERHDRLRPGINHLAFTVADRAALDSIRASAAEHGWSELYAEKYPHAGSGRTSRFGLRESDREHRGHSPC